MRERKYEKGEVTEGKEYRRVGERSKRENKKDR